MTFSPDAFEQDLDQLRGMWLDVQTRLSGPHRRNKGFLNSLNESDATRPSWHAGNEWITRSNHEELVKTVWEAKIKAIFESLDENIRRIPALDHPRMNWHLGFEAGNGQIDYQLVLLRVPMSASFVETSRHAAKRLSRIEQNMPDFLPGPHNKTYELKGSIIVARDETQAREIHATLRGTDIVDPMLEITEISI